MEATLQALDELTEKIKKSISKKNREQGVNLLTDLLTCEDGAKQVVRYLMKMQYSMCQSFFEIFVLSNSEENIFSIADALINDEQFNKGNVSNIMYPKGLSVVMVLASKEKYQSALIILDYILSKSEKSGKFPDGLFKSFKKIIVDKDGLPFIISLLESITSGAVPCKEFEQKRLTGFLEAFDNKPFQKNPIKPPLAQSQNKESAEILLLGKLAQTQEDMLAILRRLEGSNKSEPTYSAESNQNDEPTIVNYQAEEDTKLLDAEAQIADLTERLRISIQMNDISKSQEIVALKSDISETLKLDYTDYLKSRENPYDQDLFEAYRSTLSRIFKLLKRHGIPCE